MFSRLFRKIVKNKWMFICMLIGVLLSTAIVCSVPIYSRATLDRVLIKDMEIFQKERNTYPGYFIIKKKTAHANKLKSIENTINNNIKKEINDEEIPIISEKTILCADELCLTKVDADEKEDNTIRKNLNIKAVSDIEKHITIVEGRMYCDKVADDGVYEVIVRKNFLSEYNMHLDRTYKIWQTGQKRGNIKFAKIKIVGIFELNKNDTYWLKGEWNPIISKFIMDYSLFTKEFINKNNVILSNNIWEIAYDYKYINTINVDHIINLINDKGKVLLKNNDISIRMPAIETLGNYKEKEKEVQIVLWIFQTPILIMLIFYIIMITNLIIEDEKDEISLLRSRGASTKNIVYIYFLEALVISVISILIGPLLGAFFVKIIGCSSGFLEFVDRKALRITITYKEYLLSIFVAFIYLITTLIPTAVASKKSIVLRKQSKSIKKNKSFWKKYFIDIILLGICFYGLRSYKMRQEIINLSIGINASDIPVDPLLYVMITFFIIGLGLLFLRIYPYIIKIILRIGKNIWSPETYSSLINVSRSNNRNQYIMLFIILTVSIGIFNIKVSGTMNTTLQEEVQYLQGADIKLEAYWHGVDNGDEKPVFYIEPTFSEYKNLNGVNSATKVYITYDNLVRIRKNLSINVKLMGIIPHEFGKVAWFRENLLPVHWYNYLNVMAKEPKAILLSTSLKNKYNINIGDTLNITWANGIPVDFIVAGFVDYWPTYNHNEDRKRDLIIASLNYMAYKTSMQPYQVWIKKDSAHSANEIYSDIEKKGIVVKKISDTQNEIINLKNDSIVQGMNGTLTLGFISAIFICSIGFLIYWILSLKARILDFGILRAMGMSLKRILKMIILEHVFITGTAIAIGVIIGQITSRIFMPLLNIAKNAEEHILPIRIISYGDDYIRFTIILGSILVIVIIILIRYICRIKIDQAVKLGED